MRGVVLLLAAGGGTRLGSQPKAFVTLAGTSLIRRAADAACAAELVDALVVAVPKGCEERARAELDGSSKPVTIVEGGEDRQGSAASALKAAAEAQAIVVHDAARALCPADLFDVCLRELDDVEAVCVAVPVSDTVKELDEDVVLRTLDRRSLAAAQTPQAFRADVYRRAHEAARSEAFVATDDAALVSRLGVAVRIVPGDQRNIKITTPLDLLMAEALLEAR